MERITVIVHDGTDKVYDIEVPLDISARELIVALHSALHHAGACPAAIRCENPIAFLAGDRLLGQFNLRDGSNIYFYGEETA